MKQDQIEKHSTAQSVILHLLPGILVGCFYFLALKPVAKMGYPSIFAQFLAFAFILVPFELGFLLFRGRKKPAGLHFGESSVIKNQSRGGNTSYG